MEKLKPCSFCKAENTDVGFIGHTSECYLMRKYLGDTKDNLRESWNTRPIEDELQTRIAELENHINGILSVLREIIDEAITQDPFSDNEGMALLYGARILLGDKQ